MQRLRAEGTTPRPALFRKQQRAIRSPLAWEGISKSDPPIKDNRNCDHGRNRSVGLGAGTDDLTRNRAAGTGFAVASRGTASVLPGTGTRHSAVCKSRSGKFREQQSRVRDDGHAHCGGRRTGVQHQSLRANLQIVRNIELHLPTLYRRPATPLREIASPEQTRGERACRMGGAQRNPSNDHLSPPPYRRCDPGKAPIDVIPAQAGTHWSAI